MLDDTVGAARTDAKMLAAILTKIKTDPVNERVIARTDPRIVNRLPVDLTRSSALTVLRALQATLPSGCRPQPPPARSRRPWPRSARKSPPPRPPSARPCWPNRHSWHAIESAVTRAQSLTALAALGAGLREILNAGMRGAAGAESAPMLRAVAAAPAGQRSEVLADGATRTQLTARLTKPDNLRMLGALGAPFVDQLNATVTGPGAADGASAVKLAAAAPAAGRDLARADRDLMGRLQAALTPAQMRSVLVGLHASLPDILTLVIGTPAGAEADLLKVIGAADATGRHAALDDAGLIGRIKGALAVEPAWNVRQMLAFGSKAAINAASPQIPALSNGAVFRVDAHIKAGELPDAFTTALASLVKGKKVDPAKFTGITFAAAGAVDAVTTFPGFAADAKTGKFAPTGKPTIQVGAPGMVNPSVLVSSILREAARAARESKPAGTDPSSAAASGAQAVESLLYEVEHRADSGIGQYGARMHELGTRLTTAYTALDAAGQKRLAVRYKAAQKVIDKVPAAAAPAAAVSLTAAVSAELAKVPVVTAAIVTAITGATDAARRPVAENHDLVNRITTTMTRPDALTVLTLLHAPLTQRVEFLLAAGAPSAEVVTAITGAGDKGTLSKNRALLDRVISKLGDAEVGPVLAVLGGSLADELDRALRGATPAAAVASAIASATPANRQAAERNQALLEKIKTALGAFEFWRVQLLLRFGTAAGLPSAATKLLVSLAGGPAIAAIRTEFRKLTDAELTAAKTLPGDQGSAGHPAADPADLVIALRMLDQGMLDEQTGMGGAVAETLQVAERRRCLRADAVQRHLGLRPGVPADRHHLHGADQRHRRRAGGRQEPAAVEGHLGERTSNAPGTSSTR